MHAQAQQASPAPRPCGWQHCWLRCSKWLFAVDIQHRGTPGTCPVEALKEMSAREALGHYNLNISACVSVSQSDASGDVSIFPGVDGSLYAYSGHNGEDPSLQ
eukprot:scaffold93407_cov31-Tisochrysis_lutea.AAC.1